MMKGIKINTENKLKVLEYGDFVSAPYCSKLLADLGADVIKIEEPSTGDIARKWGPFKNDIPDQEGSGLFLYLNRNKRGITLNLNTSTGKELFKKLISRTDILIENKPPSFWTDLGLGFEDLNSINPKLIMTSITPFGQTGDYKDYRSSELISIQMSGIGYGSPGQIEDIENLQPLKVAAIQLEFMAGVVGALVARLAVLARDTAPAGQHIDVSTQEVGAWVGLTNFSQYFYVGLNPTRAKGGYEITGPMHTLPCADGYVHLECLEEIQWRRFVSVIGNPDWADLEVFQNLASRGENWDALKLLIVDAIKDWKAEELSVKSQAAGVPCSVVRKPSDLVSLRQTIAPDFFVEMNHPIAGNLLFPGNPYRLSTMPDITLNPAPFLGQHNKEILCGDVGIGEESLARLRSLQVI